MLQPFLPSVLDGLIHLAAQFSSEVLNLVMETLCIVCTVDPEFTASVESKICPFTIAIFLKYSNGMLSGKLCRGEVPEVVVAGGFRKLSLGSGDLTSLSKEIVHIGTATLPRRVLILSLSSPEG